MAAPAPVEAAVVRARRLVVALSGLLSVAYLAFTDAGPSGHADHFNYLRTVQHMQDGQGYYPAMRQAFLDGGVTLGRARAFRLPTIFWLWRWIPESLLYATFLLVVVVGTTWLMVRITNHPWAALPVALYLASAGRLANTAVSELWLLVEFWSVPALAGGVLAWERGRDGLSAGCFLLAALLREVSAPLLCSGLLVAHLRGRTRRPWLVALGVFSITFAVHLVIAQRYVVTPGNDADLVGTGNAPWSVFGMATFPLPGATALWLIPFALGLYQAWRRDLLLLLAPVFGLPILGLVVDRPYWGIVVVPFTLLLAGELVAERISDARRRGAAAEGSSPPAGTPTPGRGTPAAAPAPASA